MKSFEDLECWKKAAEMRRRVSSTLKSFPQEERFRLADQMIRAARSAPAQIAEGYGRFHYQENIQYCRQARGSLYELLDHLITASEEKYVSLDQLEQYRSEIGDCLGLLNGYINYLRRAKEKQGGVEEEAASYETGPINE